MHCRENAFRQFTPDNSSQCSCYLHSSIMHCYVAMRPSQCWHVITSEHYSHFSSNLTSLFPLLSLISPGIHLKQKDESTPFAFFTYCPAPFMTTPVRVDWKILTPEAIVSQHICYYKLQPEDNLGDVLGRCNSQHTKAIFLVNCEDGYSLPQSVLQGEFPQPPFPVCILSSHEGQQMLGMVEAYEVGDLLTKVESSSMSDSLAKSSKSPSPDELSLSLQNGTFLLSFTIVASSFSMFE